MRKRLKKIRLTSFQIIILGFLGVILVGSLLLALPIASKERVWTSFEDTLFTSTSAVCVTGLVTKDTATYWSLFGQIVILVLIQIGGLGIMTIMTLLAKITGAKIGLLQRNAQQDSISAHQVGGIVKMTSFVFKVTIIVELAGAISMLPTFCSEFGAYGIWMALFHSISAFCNAGFDLMGDKYMPFSSLTYFSSNYGIVIPICILIVVGGIGFLTWEDIVVHKFRIKKYKMQSKVILVMSLILILGPAIFMFFVDFADYPMKERIALSIFQAITPRTAGFNTASFSDMTILGRVIIIILMLIGGSPGSTAGGMKTTTVAVLFANVMACFRRRKSLAVFARKVDDGTTKNASALLIMYITLALSGTFAIYLIEKIPFEYCLFEAASAIGTVGLSMGVTPSLSLASHLILACFMFLGRVGGLTLIFAALGNKNTEVAQYPVEKINVG